MKSLEEMGLREHLHDSVLLKAVLDWDSGEVVLSVSTWSLKDNRRVDVVLRVTDITLFHVPKEHPWGDSVHINQVYGPLTLPNERLRMEIEMQSGDTIVLEAAGFDLDVKNQAP
jgi:hypothetical protein